MSQITLFLIIILFSSLCFASENVENKMKKLHVMGMYDTISNSKYSHFDNTSLIINFAKTMHLHGWKVIEYGIESTESGADQFVQLMSEEEMEKLKIQKGGNEKLKNKFFENLKKNLKKTLQNGEIVIHTPGMVHNELLSQFPNAYHVELWGTGDSKLNLKIFYSFSLLHYYYGKTLERGNKYYFMVPRTFEKSSQLIETPTKEGELIFIGKILIYLIYFDLFLFYSNIFICFYLFLFIFYLFIFF